MFQVLKDGVLSCVDKDKYLGVHISDDQKDDFDIYQQIKVVCICVNIIINKVKYCCEEVKVKLFMLYWAQLWHESVRKLQTTYNRIFNPQQGIQIGCHLSLLLFLLLVEVLCNSY